MIGAGEGVSLEKVQMWQLELGPVSSCSALSAWDATVGKPIQTMLGRVATAGTGKVVVLQTTLKSEGPSTP